MVTHLNSINSTIENTKEWEREKVNGSDSVEFYGHFNNSKVMTNVILLSKISLRPRWESENQQHL